MKTATIHLPYGTLNDDDKYAISNLAAHKGLVTTEFETRKPAGVKEDAIIFYSNDEALLAQLTKAFKLLLDENETI